jgi:hypothetical protein
MATCKTLLIRSFVIAAVCSLLSSTPVSADRGRPGEASGYRAAAQRLAPELLIPPAPSRPGP